MAQISEEDVAAVAGSDFFDEAHYAAVSGISGDRTDLVRHYLRHGEAQQHSPSEAFDVVFYQRAYPGVARDGMSPLLHYIRFGVREGLYPNHRTLRVDARKIEQSGLFDRRLFADQHKTALISGLTEIESYLTHLDECVQVTGPFDPTFYVAAYDDVPRNHGQALLHYLDVGRRQMRVPNPLELDQWMRAITRDFVASYYLSQFPAGQKPDDPLRHYVLHGERLGLDPAPDFSVDYYSRRNPDIIGKLPFFWHFIIHGRTEARVGRPNLADWTIPGERPFDLSKPTIAVMNHEASRTGAPLVGLTINAHMCERYNVIVGVGRGGELEKEFLKHSCLAIVGHATSLDAEYILKDLKKTHAVEAILLNSVETGHFALAALHAGIPCVALLHEFPEYTVPRGRMATVVEVADRVIVPAELIRESLQNEVTEHRGQPANNVSVRPQGCLPHLPSHEEANDLTREQIRDALRITDASSTKIVLGAGFVQMRKGVDLFVQTAAELRAIHGDDIRFVWVGDGWDPEFGLDYSTWVADMIKRLDVKDQVYFLRPQGSLDTLFDLADVFYLPSRLDPFPNVALDAFKAGKAVVCFEQATGIATTFSDGAVGAAVPYCDVRAAARALAVMITDAKRSEAGTNERFAAEHFDFDDYVRFLEREFEAAAAARSDVVAAARRIEASGAFEVRFHEDANALDTAEARRRAILDYAARGAKGLLLCNPRPGFSEGRYRSFHPEQFRKAGPALDRAIEAHDPTSLVTHRCVILDRRKLVQPFRGRIALHLHLHYPELALDYTKYLAAAECNADLYITTTSAQKALEIQYAFRDYTGGAVRVTQAPNRGRDIGPLLTDLETPLRAGRYDVIGHLHGKRSLAVDGSMGDRWRSYLLDTLVGDRETFAEVLALFNDPNVGLVFAEDRHCVGWTKNAEIAEDLARRLVPKTKLPTFPVFPLGTMFWTRPAVLEPLWQQGFEVHDFPVEPAPYDGSLLHALERMLPAICEGAGLDWATVYRPGSSW